MKTTRFAAVAMVLGLAGSSSAQTFLNEIYASHSGTDNQEFIELVGPANQSLNGYAILIVEGDDPVKGTLDRVYDLTGSSIPVDGYFVAGNTGIGPDFDIGNDNAIENGSETFYLVSNADISALNALLGTNLDPDGDLATDIPNLATIEDIVAMVDADFPGGGGSDLDRVYDGAPVVGPDGTFFPAGIYRGGDYPSPWCDLFLDFDVTANLNQPRTPGATNSSCPGSEPGIAYCFGNACPCFDDSTAGCGNSTGQGALLSGSGSTSVAADDLVLTITSMPAFQNGIIFGGPSQLNLPFGDGRRCVGGTVVRFPIHQANASGSFSEGPGIAAFAGYVAGQTVNFQGWFRDPAGTCTGAAFNLTNGYSIAFGI